MIEEIEVQLKGTIRVMNRRRGEATGGNVQRNVPPVVQPGSESEADLAYDLRPHMKRGTGVFPRSIWERRPAVRQVAHSGFRGFGRVVHDGCSAESARLPRKLSRPGGNGRG